MPRRDELAGDAIVSPLRRLMFVAAVVGLPPCALAQSDAVQVVGERSALAGCANLGEVRGLSVMGIIIENYGFENAVDEMKEKSLALGATHLLLHGVERTMTGSRGRGDAYGCPLRSEIPAERPQRRR